MASRLLAQFVAAACLFIAGGAAQAAVTFSGTDGVYNNIFNGNSVAACTGCHSSALVGAVARSSAPADINFNTYANATAYSATYLEYADEGAGVRVSGGSMPVGGALSDGEKALLAAWVSQRSGSTPPPNTLAPSVTTNAASSVGKYAATLNASVNDSGADASYVFQYGLTTGYGSTTGTLTTVGTGGGLSTTAISTSISGLSCGTTYNFRGRGTNGTGTTNGGNASFSTSACPAVTSISGTTTQNENTAFSLTTNTTGGVTTFSLSGQPSGMTINSSTGAISWPAANTPDTPEVSTTYNFTVVVGDGTSSSNYPTSVTVTPVNNAPSISSSANTSATEAVAYGYTVTATDTESDTLSYSLTTAPAGMTIGASTGVISWTPPQAASNYTANVTVQVTDNGTVNGTPSAQSSTQSFTINVSADNDAPSITSSANTTATEGVAYGYTVTATDPESQTLTYSLTTAPAGMTIGASSGVISWTPPQALSNYTASVTVRVTDGTNPVTQSFTVNVSADNDAPAFTSVDITTASENSLYSYTVTATDPESQTLAYSLTTAPAGMTIDASSGVIGWTPPEADSSYTANVTVRVTDGTNPVTRSFTITVTSSNDAPSFTSTDVTSATEGVAYGYTVTATDPEGGTLSYSLTTAPAGMTIGASSGVIGWTPPQALGNYTANVTVRVTDGTNPVTRSFTITVSADNDAPSFTSSDVTSVAEDTAYSYTVTATDPESQTLTYSLTTAPTGMTIGASSGAIGWTPPLNFNGTANVTVRVTDGTNPVARSFSITVTAVNDAPVVTSTAVTSSPEDTAYSYTVTASDVDGDTLSYSLTTKPTGMVIGASSGVISWTPSLNFNGTVNVTVQVSDGTAADTQSFVLTITAVNDAPVITSTAVTADDGSGTYSYDVNATDIDGDTMVFSLVSAPTGMTINSSTGVIGWTVPAVITGSYAVTVRVADRADGTALTDTQSFSITLQDTDDDGISDFSDNCPSISNTDQANNEGDSQGDLCDSDDDNDSIPDTVEVANGLDPFDAADASGDLNGNGISNLNDYLACGGAPSCYTLSNPVVVTNGDQVVTASGYFTPVTLTATATGVSGPLVVTADNDGPFRPGVHTVTWSAPWRAADGSAQTATTTQQVTVKPLVTMGGSQVIGAGQTAYVPVRLIGTAPSYPVVVTFTASGATAGVDYTIAASSVQFDSPDTLKYIAVDVIDHGAAADRDLVLTLSGVTGDAVLADASQISYRLRLTMLPAPPEARLQVSQSGEIRPVVYADDGSFVVDALLSDPNGIGTASCDSWTAPGLVVGAGGSDCQVIIDPAAVAPGVYTVMVSVTDGSFTVSRSIDIALAGGNAPVLSGADTDGDGVTNDVETAVDANGNGLLDYLDVTGSDSPESIQLSLGASSLPLMAVTDSGLRLLAGTFAMAAQATTQAGIQVYESQIGSGATPVIDTDFAAIGALYDFTVSGLGTTTTTAHVVLPLTVVLLDNTRWRVLGANGKWKDFTGAGTGGFAASPVGAVTGGAGSGSGDALLSAPRNDDGSCPLPQDPAYTRGLTAGHACVQMVVTDGGPNDADGATNGSVRVTAAPTLPRDEIAAVIPTDSQSGGSADAWTLMLLALAMLAFRRKEQLQ
jgi:hypothetical protein